MQKINVNISLRPNKIGFLIDPNNEENLLKAIKINTFLWGGIYNPIIPVVNEIPENWKDKHFGFKFTPKEVISGYINAYDPDFILPIGNFKNIDLEYFKRIIIKAEDIFDKKRPYNINYGIGLFEILNYIYDKELKFERKQKSKVIIPVQNNITPFIACNFGSIPEELALIFKENYYNLLEIQEETNIDTDNYAEYIDPKIISLRKFSSIDLNIRNYYHHHNNIIFYHDANNTNDIIDYWNIRALGKKIIPLPIQSLESISTQNLLKHFIKYSYYPINENNVYNYSTVIKARSINENDFDNVGKFLNNCLSTEKDKPRFSMKKLYPRIWDAYSRQYDGYRYLEIDSKTSDIEIIVLDNEYINFKSLNPEFKINYGKSIFSNEIEIKNYTSNELIAQAFPEGKGEILKESTIKWYEGCRISKKGITFFNNFYNSSNHLKIPMASEIFINWMKSKNIKCEQNSLGIIANQIIKHLGGVFYLRILAKNHILETLNKMQDSYCLAREFKGTVQRSIREDGYFKDKQDFDKQVDRFIEMLISKKVIQLGVEIKCLTCFQKSFYTFDKLDYQLVCPKCLDQFDFPSYNYKNLKWSYKPVGPFNLPNKAYGIFTQILTLKFFLDFHHGFYDGITPVFNIDMYNENNKFEVDFSLFYKETSHGTDNKHLIFCECKSLNDFELEDINKMRFLAKEFPGSILVFATLKKELNQKEKELIKSLMDECWPYWHTERPKNPLLILTKNELIQNDISIKHKWEKIGGKHLSYLSKLEKAYTIIEFSNITTELYLDSESWHCWQEKKWIRECTEKKAYQLSEKYPLNTPETNWLTAEKEVLKWFR